MIIEIGKPKPTNKSSENKENRKPTPSLKQRNKQNTVISRISQPGNVCVDDYIGKI